LTAVMRWGGREGDRPKAFLLARGPVKGRKRASVRVPTSRCRQYGSSLWHSPKVFCHPVKRVKEEERERQRGRERERETERDREEEERERDLVLKMNICSPVQEQSGHCGVTIGAGTEERGAPIQRVIRTLKKEIEVTAS
jgi:hypothetical protein